MSKFNSENMTEFLDRFGKKYNFPVYICVNNMSSFYSSRCDIRSGYAAVTDDYFLIFVQMPLIGNENNADYFRLPVLGMKRLKVKKFPLLNSFTIDIKGVADGKKYNFRLITASNVDGNGFPDQKENQAGFIEKLKKWSKEI